MNLIGAMLTRQAT
jgi:hypothetical protein